MNLNHLDYSVYLSVSGFISIDCGLPASSSYSETTTGINYISDAAFIDTGESKKISTEFRSSVPRQTWNLRSFPQGIRNCYSINITQGTKYLILATFFYGNYDGESKLPHFDLHLGANMWDTIKIEKVSDSFIKELIHVPSLNYIQVCLVNTQLGTPFISAIELRPLDNKTYVTTDGSLALFWRVDVGSVSNITYRLVIWNFSFTFIKEITIYKFLDSDMWIIIPMHIILSFHSVSFPSIQFSHNSSL